MQKSFSPPHLQSSVQTMLFSLHEHLLEHLDFSQLHLTSCSTDTGAGATRERTGSNFWHWVLNPNLSGPSYRKVGFDTRS